MAWQFHAFICPECGTHHFGTTTAANRDDDVVNCHDQNDNGCNWSGPYKDHVDNADPEEEIISSADMTRLADLEEMVKCITRIPRMFPVEHHWGEVMAILSDEEWPT